MKVKSETILKLNDQLQIKTYTSHLYENKPLTSSDHLEQATKLEESINEQVA